MSTGYFQLNKTSRFVSPIQKKMMLGYLRRNPELMSAKFSHNFNFKDAQIKWSEMARMLNRMPGSRKHWKQWRKTWHDLRSKVKLKHVQGGPIYSESDKDILKLIGELKSTTDYNTDDDVKAEDDFDESEGKVVCLHKILSTMEDDPLSFGANQKNVIIELSPGECLDEEQVCENDTSFESHNGVSMLDKVETKRNNQSMSQQSYREQKLKLLKKIASAKEKSAVAKERIATALEKIAQSRTSF